MTDETHRFFRINDRPTYEAMSADIDASRGFPNERGTLRGLPTWDSIEPAHDGARYICVDRWRFTAEENEQVAQIITSGAADELTLEQYIGMLGGLDARVDIDEASIISTEEL